MATREDLASMVVETRNNWIETGRIILQPEQLGSEHITLSIKGIIATSLAVYSTRISSLLAGLSGVSL